MDNILRQLDIYWNGGFWHYAIPVTIIYFITLGLLILSDPPKKGQLLSILIIKVIITFIVSLFLSIFLVALPQTYMSSTAKNEWSLQKESVLLNINTENNTLASGSVAGSSFLGIGGFSGEYNETAGTSYHFYMNDNGYIIRKVVPHDTVKFKYGSKPNVKQYRYIKEDRRGDRFYIGDEDVKGYTEYIITVPEGSIGNYIILK